MRPRPRMTIDRLIKALQKAKALHGGDIPVVVDTDARAYCCHIVDVTYAGMNFSKRDAKKVGMPLEFTLCPDDSCGLVMWKPKGPAPKWYKEMMKETRKAAQRQMKPTESREPPPQPPAYARIFDKDGTAVAIVRANSKLSPSGWEIWRDAGNWGARCWYHNGRWEIHDPNKSSPAHHLNGLPLIPTTEEDWRKDNAGYIDR